MLALGSAETDQTGAAPSRHERRAIPRSPVVAIGSSTGGVDALHEILAAFPENCPPTLVVQHISGMFTPSLAKGLARACRARVVLAEDAMPLQSGQIYIAPGNARHLTVVMRQRPVCRLAEGPAVAGHRPSIDELFRSCAQFGAATCAALLTGMGRDGAEGLLAIRRQGGRTVAQDARTSLIFGMARVAQELGAVERMLPLNRIAAALMEAASCEPGGLR